MPVRVMSPARRGYRATAPHTSRLQRAWRGVRPRREVGTFAPLPRNQQSARAAWFSSSPTYLHIDRMGGYGGNPGFPSVRLRPASRSEVTEGNLGFPLFVYGPPR